MNFPSPQSLEIWLSNHGIDTAAWGTSGAKTVTDLWHELKHGDVVFSTDPPLRLVRVVQVIIRRDDYLLYELAQDFSDGRIRRRQQPPSEKIVAGESLTAAAERCLCEELDLNPHQYHISDAVGEKTQTEAESPSYPGLRTRYTVYTVEAAADDLPETDFWRENEAAAAGDPVKRHLFGWRRTL